MLGIAVVSTVVLSFAVGIKNWACFHTWTASLYFRSRRFVLNQFAHFPVVILCSHCVVVKWAKAHTPASCVLVTQCVVWRRHDNSNKMSCGLTWCTEEVKCLVDIWEDEQLSPDVGHHHSVCQIRKVGSNKWKQGLRMLCSRYKIILSIMTSDLLVPVAMQHIGCWVGCVLTPLRVQMESNQITSSRRSGLCWFIPPRATVVFTHIPKQTDPKEGKTLLCQNVSNLSGGKSTPRPTLSMNLNERSESKKLTERREPNCTVFDIFCMPSPSKKKQNKNLQAWRKLIGAREPGEISVALQDFCHRRSEQLPFSELQTLDRKAWVACAFLVCHAVT